MTPDQALSMLDDLDQPGQVYVTAWEADFMDSLLRQIEDEGRGPTEKQSDTLRRIHYLRMRQSRRP